MSAVGDVVGGVLGSITGSTQAGGIGKGTALQVEQIEQGISELERQFGATKRLFNPFIKQGGQAFQQQAAFSGALGPEAQAQAFEGFTQSPGQQYLQQQAEKALLRTAAARGGLGGGNVQRALQEQAIGMAQQDFENQFNRLGAVSGAGLGFASQLGGLRQGLGTNVANLRSSIGQAQNLGAQGQAEARAQGGANILGLGLGALTGGLF